MRGGVGRAPGRGRAAHLRHAPRPDPARNGRCRLPHRRPHGIHPCEPLRTHHDGGVPPGVRFARCDRRPAAGPAGQQRRIALSGHRDGGVLPSRGGAHRLDGGAGRGIPGVRCAARRRLSARAPRGARGRSFGLGERNRGRCRAGLGPGRGRGASHIRKGTGSASDTPARRVGRPHHRGPLSYPLGADHPAPVCRRRPAGGLPRTLPALRRFSRQPA